MVVGAQNRAQSVYNGLSVIRPPARLTVIQPEANPAECPVTGKKSLHALRL